MPSTDRRTLLKYTAVAATGVVGVELLRTTTASPDGQASWGPPSEGDGDWAIIDRDTDRFTAEDVECSVVLTVQGPNDGSDRFYGGGPGLRIVSYEATISDDNREWNYTVGPPRLVLRLRAAGESEDVVYFSNTRVYGNSPETGEIPGRRTVQHTFNPGSGRGAVNPLLNRSPPPDGDGTGLNATMESTLTVPVRKAWMRESGGQFEAATLRCEITETVTFVG